MTARRADTGQLAGFLIDVLQEITTALHLRSEDLEFHETDWQSFAFGLQEGKFDLSIGGTFQTPARLCLVAFTRPLGHLGNGALVRSQDERFAAARDIFSFNRANLTLAVVMGEQGSEYAHKNLTLSKFRDLPGSDLTQPCLEVAGGRADAALSDQYILRRCVDSQPGVLKDVLSDRPYLVLPISWAVRKSDKRWLDFLDAQIAVLDQSGWLQRRRESYVSIPWANSANASPVIPGSCGLPLSIYGSAFLTGLGYTFLISLASITLGTLFGFPMGLAIASGRRQPWFNFVATVTRFLIYVFLAVPALVLIIILYYNSLTSFMSANVAATLALSFNLTPFVATIIASAVRNIDRQYLDAATVMGYSKGQIDVKFRIPLMLRACRQPLLVQYYTTLKLSSLASVIGVTELLHRSQQVIRETYMTLSVYLIMVVCYVLLVSPCAYFADKYELIAEKDRG
jgi:ABC-type amino acid transport system permease subunit/ABC-type amino acid transport substrate-binding protein